MYISPYSCHRAGWLLQLYSIKNFTMDDRFYNNCWACCIYLIQDVIAIQLISRKGNKLNKVLYFHDVLVGAGDGASTPVLAVSFSDPVCVVSCRTTG